MRGRRYDAFRLRKSDGAGTWWEGLDPQVLYTGPSFAPPDGIDSIAEMNAWHDARDGQWLEHAPPQNPSFVRNWLRRQITWSKVSPGHRLHGRLSLPFGQTGSTRSHIITITASPAAASSRRADRQAAVSHYQRYGIVEMSSAASSAIRRGRGRLTQSAAGTMTGLCSSGTATSRRAPSSALRHRLKERQSAAQRAPARRRLDRRGRVAILEALARWFAQSTAGDLRDAAVRVYGEGRPAAARLQNGRCAAFHRRGYPLRPRRGALNALFLDWPDGEAAITRWAPTRCPRRGSSGSK